ncbi:unnamed protein product [Paramecium primaurelia]|uniref:Transmembrane protein n=1 Tax=Paramecium primaurelia TaxID=5886 RepID=A0A8S1KUZ6_PARPR|nr:unnamed protein product [Paramecium primaurelia]
METQAKQPTGSLLKQLGPCKQGIIQREIKRIVTLARFPLHSPQFVVNVQYNKKIQDHLVFTCKRSIMSKFEQVIPLLYKEDLLQQLCLLQQTFLISLTNFYSQQRQRKSNLIRPIQIDSKMIEEIPQSKIVSGRKAHITSQTSFLIRIHRTGKREEGKGFVFILIYIIIFLLLIQKQNETIKKIIISQIITQP